MARRSRRSARRTSASEKRTKVTKEVWFLQQSPQGSMVVVYFEAADPAKGMEAFAKSKDTFDVWMTKQVKDISCADLSKPFPGPLPEQLLSFGF